MVPRASVVAAGVSLGLLALETATGSALAFPGAARLGVVLLVWAAAASVPRGGACGAGASRPLPAALLALPVLALAGSLDAADGLGPKALVRLGLSGLLLLGLLDQAAERGRGAPLRHARAWLLVVVLPACLAAALGFARDPFAGGAGAPGSPAPAGAPTLLEALLGASPLTCLHAAARDPRAPGLLRSAGALLVALGLLLLARPGRGAGDPPGPSGERAP